MDENILKNATDYISVIRNMIHHEDQLVNQRLTWMWTLQGLLFASVSFIIKIDNSLVLLIGSIGIIASISIGYNISRGYKAIKELLTMSRDYKSNLADEYVLPPTIGSRSGAIEWLLPGRLLPWVFSIAWIALLIIIFCKV